MSNEYSYSRPKRDGDCKYVWDICDALSLVFRSSPSAHRRAVIGAAEGVGIKRITAGVQYGLWRDHRAQRVIREVK